MTHAVAPPRGTAPSVPGGELYPRRWWALAVLALSLVVIGMDNTILNVALPTLQRDLTATASQLQWMVDSYVLVFAGLLLTMGALGDRFGRKLALDAGLVIFVAASVGSAFAGSAEMLIATRALMGIGGALIMPSTLSIITATFPPHERGRAIAAWAAIAGLGIIAGPVVGGWLLEHFWWGSVFLVNVPIVTIALVAGLPLVPESKDPGATPLDPVGALLSIGGLTALVYGIIEAPDSGWTAGSTLLAFGTAAVLLGAFVAWEFRTTHPMLQMSFFRNPRFSAASASITLIFFALFGSVFVLTQHLQFVLGYSALQAGVRITPFATLVVAAPIAARVVERIGTKIVVAAGLAIAALGLILIAGVDAGDGYAPIGWSLALIGLGMGTTMAPATDSIMGSLPLAKAGVGSAMNDTTRMVGGALGVAIIGSVLSSSYSSTVAPALAQLPRAAAAVAEDSVGGALEVAQRAGPAAGNLAVSARAAFVDAMGDAVLVGAAAALFGALVALALLPARPRDEAKGEERQDLQTAATQ
jgi:EmrB/QacA subfamily drug resistance transporter